MRKPVLFVAFPMAVLVSACGSSSSSPAAATPSASVTVAGASAAPTVGPTDASASPNPQPAAVDLQIIKRNGAALIVAPVKVQGKVYDFIVDTGATATLIDSSFAKALGLKRTKAAPIPVNGVAGSTTAYLATISNWSIGRSQLPTSTITVGNLGLSSPDLVGLLGSDVLSTFGKITIDYDKQKATLG